MRGYFVMIKRLTMNTLTDMDSLRRIAMGVLILSAMVLTIVTRFA